MKLMTKETKKKLRQYPFRSQIQKGLDAEVIVQYFNAHGHGTWLVIEGEKMENDDWMLFVYFHDFEWKRKIIWLSELENLNSPSCHSKIKRVLYIGRHLRVKDFL